MTAFARPTADEDAVRVVPLPSAATPPDVAWPYAGGEMGEAIRLFDWRETPVGPREHWTPALRNALTLMLNSPESMYLLWGPELVFFFNDAYRPILGPRLDGALGQPLPALWADAWPSVQPTIELALRGESSRFEDLPIPMARYGEPEQTWWSFSFSPLYGDEGRIEGVFCATTETTGRVRARQRLQGERQRLARMFEQAPSFMALLVGPEHRIELANPRYLALVGNRQVVGRPLGEALGDAVEQGYLRLLDEVYRTGQPYTAESARYDVQPYPGAPIVEHYVDFVLQPLMDPDGVVTGIVVQGVDVTARTRDERRRHSLIELDHALRDGGDPHALAMLASELLGRALGANRVGYGTIDELTATLHCAGDWTLPGVPSVAGLTPLRHYGSFIDDMQQGLSVAINDTATDPRTCDPGQVERLADLQVRAFVNESLLEHGRLVAMFFVTDDKPRVWSDDDLAFIREVASRARVAIERSRGVQALRELNETLEQRVAERTQALLAAEAQLRQSQKMEAVGQLTGGLAHDFNNLLTAVTGGLELLRSRLAQRRYDELERYLGMAQNGARRAAALTQRLLAFSRRQTLAPTVADVDRLVAGMREIIARTLGPGVALDVRTTEGLWSVLIDTPQLESALLNLCINARDAMPDGGHLVIATGHVGLAANAASELDLPAGEYVTLSVTDDGIGMSSDIVGKIFDPFFTTKPTGQGTGLGLSMIYGFTRQSGGQVRVASTPGLGTAMTLYLPRHADAVPAGEAPVVLASDAGSLAGASILVIEDEAPIRALMAEVLADAGCRVLEAADGAAGLRVLRGSERIDLLITDVGLPGGLNGRQVADAGRAVRPGLRVLFVTGYASKAAVGAGDLDEGMSVLTKPFNVLDLESRVRDLIAGRGQGG
ncbi:PAS domain-containing protein [Achromobacter sp. GG226]|uniref:ATP-binding protein n=1 Tax=Verticiella alkaliphila TaxID=2779529 RepID=UPI001C0B2F49|nr:ATP-binding protein [Verticiella sp. GG226]MBU4612563.1 PAS domain-containing protein [Verticiella sp. GG226]